ncbi:MAG: hypothetical protein EOO60_02410 [Hymenobacter sp.]|nr:MAG: hypothetical protein EOO60_02410 [Hymenobacter sp.]
MAQEYLPSLALLTRLHSPYWQDLLHQSMHLYLALGAEPAAATKLDTQLQSLEQELLDYLLVGEPAVLAARQLAQVFLDMAQHELLSSKMAGWDLMEFSVNSSPSRVAERMSSQGQSLASYFEK